MPMIIISAVITGVILCYDIENIDDGGCRTRSLFDLVKSCYYCSLFILRINPILSSF